jgi:hypothetical protein
MRLPRTVGLLIPPATSASSAASTPRRATLPGPRSLEHVVAREAVGLADLPDVRERPVGRDRWRAGVRHPDEPHHDREVLAELLDEALGGVVRREDLHDELGGDVQEALLGHTCLTPIATYSGTFNSESLDFHPTFAQRS